MSVASALESLPERFKAASAAHLILWAIAAFVAVFVAWAAFARLDEVSRGQGRIIPSRQLQIVSNLEGGFVKAILVHQGDSVRAGQVLIRLDATLSSAEFGKNETGFNAIFARITRLQAEVDEKPLIFPGGLTRAAPTLVVAEQALYSARKRDLATALSVAQSKLDQAQRLQGQAQVAVSIKAEELALARRELAMIEPLVEMGAEPQIQLARSRSAVAQAAGGHREAQLGVSRASAAVSEAAFEARAVREEYRTRSFDQLAAAKAELAAMGRTLPALEDRVRRTEVRAPVSGTVNRVLVMTVGGTVKPGEPLIEIVPKDDSLVVEVQMRPADIAFIRPGQKATVKITAYNYSVYGGLEGRVESISPDAVVDTKDGSSHYLVRVRTVGRGPKASDNSPLPITPGMIAEVDILGDKRSVLSYLLSPLTQVQEKALRER